MLDVECSMFIFSFVLSSSAVFKIFPVFRNPLSEFQNVMAHPDSFSFFHETFDTSPLTIKNCPVVFSQNTLGSPAFYKTSSRSTSLLRFTINNRTVAFRPPITRGLALSWVHYYPYHVMCFMSIKKLSRIAWNMPRELTQKKTGPR